MSKRITALLIFAAFLMTLHVIIPQSAGAQSPIVLKYANFPPAPTFPCVQMERWAKEVEKRTAGKVKIQTFPGGTLLPAKNIFDGVISGTADIGNFAMSYQPGRFPVSEAIDLPIGFNSARAASMALYDLIEKYNPKEFEKVKLLTFFTCPPADLMTKTPVKSLKDLKGMELRASGTGAEVLKRLGATPIGMPQSEAPEAIQKGIVKGNVSSMEILKDFNFAAYLPYATEANLFVVTFSVVMNKDKWNSLPADVKKVLDDLRREQAEWTGKYVDDHVKESLKWSKEKYNHQLIQLSTGDLAEISKLTKPMIDDYIKKVNAMGLPGDQIIKDVYALKEKYQKIYK
ncbi:MAG TPA: TRAP transporter substrate-binding protein [Syntrophorhabdaceae bacterium]|nr:TRAP transporter substrate-binding protein [Syntrophorhabdaceae bacterium]HQM81422.1 TRAP transporter substrate-binding protein [Syntrophorhabdaceae bacterium]